MRKYRKVLPSFLHIPTGIYRSIVGAREAELGRVFVTIESVASRERMFLVSTFDGNKAEMDALFETLRAREIARVKTKNRKEIAEAKMRDARSRVESDEDEYLEQQYRDLGEESSADYEPDDPLQPIDNSEIIEESEGHEPLPEAEAEDENVEVFED